MIPRDTVERIFSAARIEDVVGDYVSLKKRGANMIGLCPFHDEKTGSFTVSPSKGIYKCFGCGKSGHVAGFLMEIEQCSYTEALRMLAKKYNIEVEERELTQEEQQRQDDRESMFVVNEFAADWFEKQLWETQEGQAVGLSYFRERGVRDDMIRKFRLGYSPDKSLLSKAATAKGFAEKYLLNDSQNAPYIGTGVCLKSEDGRLYDRFHSRVIFPFFSRSGKVTGFAGRILKTNDKVADLARTFTYAHNFLYLGRGYSYPVALEGALKLKEISYIHAEGYPAAEMKHGPIALIDSDMPVVVIATHNAMYEKVLSNIQEIKARQGRVIALVSKGDDTIAKIADEVIELPDVLECLEPLVATIPLQLLAYHVAVCKGKNVDQPRNLAKSVTVE